MEQGLRVAVDQGGVLEGFKVAGAITLGFAYLILLGGAFLVASPLIVPVMAYKTRVEKKKFYAELPDALRPFIDQFAQLPKNWNFQIRRVASLAALVTDPVFFEHVKKIMDAYLGVYEWVMDEYTRTDRPLNVKDMETRFEAFGLFGNARKHRQKIYQALRYRMSEDLISFVTTLGMPWIENPKYSEHMESIRKYAKKHNIAEVTRQHTELQRMLDEFVGDLKEDHAQLKSLWDGIDGPQALIYWMMVRYLDDTLQERPWSEYVVTPPVPLQVGDYERIKHLATLWDDVFSRCLLRKVSDFYLLPADEDKYKALCLLFPQAGETKDNYGARLDRLERDLQGMGRWMPRWTKARHREAGMTFGLTRAMWTAWWKLFAKDEWRPGSKSRPWELLVVTMTAASLAKGRGKEALGKSELRRLEKDGDYPISNMEQPLVITSLHQPTVPEKYVLHIYNFQRRAPDTSDIIRKAGADDHAAYVCVLPAYSLKMAGKWQGLGYTGYLQNLHEWSLMEASFRVHVALDYGLDPRQVNNIEIVMMPPSTTSGSPLKPGGRQPDKVSGPRARSGPAVRNGLRVVKDNDRGGGIEDSMPAIAGREIVQGGVSNLKLSGTSLVTAAPERDDIRSPSIGGSVDALTDGVADDHVVHGIEIYSGLTPAARPTALQRGLLKTL